MGCMVKRHPGERSIVPSHRVEPGRLIKAPENFLDPQGVRAVMHEARQGRRDFIRSAFAAAVAGAGTGALRA